MLKELYNFLIESPFAGVFRSKIRTLFTDDVYYGYKCGGRELVAVSFSSSFNKNKTISRPKLLQIINLLEEDEVSIHFVQKNARGGDGVSSEYDFQSSTPMGSLVLESETKLIESSTFRKRFFVSSEVALVAKNKIPPALLDGFVDNASEFGLSLVKRSGKETEELINSLGSINQGEGSVSNTSKYGEIGVVENGVKRDVVRLEFNDSTIPLNAPPCDDLFRTEFVLNTGLNYFRDDDGPVIRTCSALNVYQDELNANSIEQLKFLFEGIRAKSPDFDVVQNNVAKWYSSMPGNPISFGFLYSLYFLFNSGKNFNEAVVYESNVGRIEDILRLGKEGVLVAEDLLGGVNSFYLSGCKVFITGERSKNIEALLVPIIEHCLANNERVIVCDSPDKSNLSMSFFTQKAGIITPMSLISKMVGSGVIVDLLGDTFSFSLSGSSSEVFSRFSTEFPKQGSTSIPCGESSSTFQFLNHGGVGSMLLALSEAINHIQSTGDRMSVIITDPSTLYDRGYGLSIRSKIDKICSIGGTVIMANELYPSIVNGGYDEDFLSESVVIGLFEGDGHPSGDLRSKLSRPDSKEGWQECFIKKGGQISFARLPFCGRIRFMSNCRHADALLISGYVDNGYTFERALVKQIGDFDV